MADTEGVDQLFPGWSSVVHRPSEDPEPSDLPSTVDMNAVFNAEVNAAPATNVQEDESSDSESDSDSDSNNSGSDESGSCSQSDSSDSDSSSTSQDSNSRPASPEFSVQQTNGLRLTIQTVRKSCNSPTEKQNKASVDVKANAKCSNLSSSSSESDSDNDNESEPKSDGSKSGGKSVKESAKKQSKKVTNKLPEKKVEKKVVKKECAAPSKDAAKKQKGKRNTKMASLPISRGSTCSSSDSDDSDADSAMLASCSLQEINQEDLAAILPDQQEIDTFGEFECRKDKNYAQNGISCDASGSDMELPQQAVNALIQRTTESSSECESQEPPNPNSLCANSLLQQFFTQTQMLNAPAAAPPAITSDAPNSNTSSSSADTQGHPSATDSDAAKKKRGRPKKSHKSPAVDSAKKTTTNKDNVDYTADPNVSPDSGIQNSPDHVSSPEASPLPNNKNKITQEKKADKPKVEAKPEVNKVTKNSLLTSKLKEQNKLPVTSNRFDRVLYGNTDRVLYPPRRKAGRPPIHRKGPGRPPKHKASGATETKAEESKPKVPVKQDKVETKSRSKKIQKVQDKEIIQLTTNTNSLTLGKSSEVEKNKPKELPVSKKPKTFVISQICERVSKRLEQSGKIPQKVDKSDIKNSRSRNQKSICKISVLAKGKIDKLRNKYTTLKNTKVMHSKHKHKKHKKCKFRILKPITAVVTHSDPKINAEIEKLVQDFVNLCNISPKPVKEVIAEGVKAFKKTSKKRKASDYSERKKKKQNTTNSVNKETSNEQRLPLKKRHYHLNANNESKQENEVVVPLNTDIDKNDKKLKENKLPQTASKVAEKKIESSKIPLNKTPPTKNSASPKASGINNNEYEVGSHIDEAIEACINKYSKDGTKLKDGVEEKTNVSMTTPKKRHLLEIANNTSTQAINAAKTNLLETLKPDDISKKPVKSIENVVTEIKLKRMSPKFTETKKESIVQMITRKKNRLEDLTLSLVSKISPPSSDDQKKKTKNEEVVSRASVIKYPVCKKVKPAETERLDSVVDPKPTGIFTPTVDLELHIPKSPVVNEKETPIKEEKIETKKEPEPEPVTTSSPDVVKIKNSESLRRRIRKRRAINRTGFPTVKKKKKKISSEGVVEIEKEENKECDRVPKEGEEYSTFVQRTECQVSIVALEKLQIPPPELDDTVSKWEVLSECDSLPQEERTEYEDLKPEKKRDISPATSIETRSSDRIKKRRDFSPERHDCQTDDDLTLEARLRRFRRLAKKHRKLRELREKGRFSFRDDRVFVKRKLRDLSPASSIEPMTEKRLREDRGSASGDDKKNRKAPRWRKKYLVAGLFSDYYKEDDETARQKRADLVCNKSRLVYNPQEHPYGLLPAPYHCGKYLRCRKIPFQLPYDLWWLHTHSQLPGRDTVPSWNYRKIRSNVYNVKLTTTGACEPQSCNCGPTSNCGDDCINRLVLVECPASHKCQNQRIQKHEWAPGLEKFMTESKGWGVRTSLPIKTGEFILEYVGEVVSDQEFKERMATRYVHDTHHYCLHLDCGLVIDGHRMGGDGRFVNHSCQPNCEMQKWSVNGQSRMALFALRDIEAGEELTYDYNFSLFNPAEGQECKCGSDNCRGVIGGKSQRVRQSTAPPPAPTGTGRVGRPRKNQAKRTLSGPKETPVPPAPPPVIPPPQLKPLTHAQKLYIQEHHCFLLRNFYKVRRCKVAGSVSIARPQTSTPTETNPSTTLINHINALRQPRNMKTRRLAQVEDDPELHKTAKLANLLRDLWNIVTKAKDEKGQQLCAAFLNLPSKRKVPEYYQRVQDPIDFTIIEQNVASGVYRTAETFDFDMNKLFSNATKYYGRTSELGIAATRLKKIYTEAKQQSAHKFEDMLGGKPLLNFISNKKKGEEEDVIRCICGMFRDEGLMIQCERCLVWQHCECVKADPSAASYHCERCVPRDVDYEIPLDEYTEHGYRYYMTLMRGSLQLRQGDTVYVLRDIPIPGTNKKHTYDTIGEIKYTDLDIFRIERLWKDFKGQRIAYGHHYLRPHETYHEPTRKFFPNEVMRVPLYEAVPVELIIEHCWVMDLNTYCKGRPMGAPEEHIYICEYRVDKTARLFSKVSKSKFPICIKSYAFERFDARLKMSRTYTPHDLDPALVKPRGRKPQDAEDAERREVQSVPLHIPIVRTRSEQKARLNKILLNLLSKLPTKQPLDVSYLLEGGRRRKKTT
ncbi:putative histone-lysine N-methyltransferase [Trypoxylus dichotomus]